MYSYDNFYQKRSLRDHPKTLKSYLNDHKHHPPSAFRPFLILLPRKNRLNGAHFSTIYATRGDLRGKYVEDSIFYKTGLYFSKKWNTSIGPKLFPSVALLCATHHLPFREPRECIVAEGGRAGTRFLAPAPSHLEVDHDSGIEVAGANIKSDSLTLFLATDNC